MKKEEHPAILFNEENIKRIIKDYLIFPVIAFTLGIATVLALIIIFPVWILKETNTHKM